MIREILMICDRDKDELVEALASVRRQLSEMQQRETEAMEKVKMGIEITEHANLEKTQVNITPTGMGRRVDRCVSCCAWLPR